MIVTQPVVYVTGRTVTGRGKIQVSGGEPQRRIISEFQADPNNIVIPERAKSLTNLPRLIGSCPLRLVIRVT
ncbi:TPA: hypothetical protein GND80_004348 [Salmonella enterica subsp. houtenae serovar 45:g,z51:-]|uniref:Uncharacterized protein n=1 Tax=Salmonella enterica subsp. houtenae serovar 45:g,z51:- TaxID=1967611 RepID=A0A753B509_SALHO|nr:hypothetical protein [Salmonella enterica subsp. houtenae serovar 45:g,z51:-]